MNVDKREAQVDFILKSFQKRGFKKVGDVFYSPESLAPIEDKRPPWSAPEVHISRVRSILFVL
jgi:hypothetical protein